MKEQLTSQEWILLSSYLDGELNPQEKMRVEALLQNNPHIQAAYESLAKTKAVLRSAPRRKAPRNFTLSPAVAQQPQRIFQWVPALRFSSAIAALAAVFMFVSQLMPGLAVRPLTAEQPAMEIMAIPQANGEENLISPESVAQTTPPVVFWGGPPHPPSTAYGLGGADTAPGDHPFVGGMGGGGEDPSLKGPPLPESASRATIDLIPQDTPVEPLPLEGSGPILGVRELEAQGQTMPDARQNFASDAVTEQEAVTAVSAPHPEALWLIASGLLALAVGLWLVSIFLKKKSL
ncbi:MAG: hypothetical protein ROW48_12655 [Bellilinea sp.]|jgi:hypothetical protein